MSARRRYVGVCIVFLACAAAAHADNFTLPSFGGNWSSTATWYQNGLPASRTPGSLVGTIDTVSLTAATYTVTMDTTAVEMVTVATTCPSNTSTCVLDVPAAGSLLLTGTSTIGSDAHIKLSGGTITNAGTLTLNTNGTFDWSAGTLTGAGMLDVKAGATVNATGASTMVLSGQAVSLAGTLTHNGLALDMSNGATLTIQSGGTYDIQTANGITSNGVANPKITVAAGGLFLKSLDNFGTNIVPVMDNNGTVRTNINTLVLTSGTHSGVFDMNGATTAIALLNFPTLQAGTVIQGLGTAFIDHVTIPSGTVTATNLSMDSFGSITGPGTLDVSGTFTWRAGTIGGAATVNMLVGSALNFTGEAAATLDAAAHINNNGSFTLSSAGFSLSVTNGGHITNNATSTITLNGDINVLSDLTATSRIDNAGTLTKTAGLASASLDLTVNNTGTVSVSSGSLNLGGGGTHAGIFTASAAGNKIVFSGGTHQFTAGTFTGSGGFKQSGGILDFDAAIAITQGFDQAAGVITGNGNLTLSAFLWEGGTMNASSGTGGTVLSGNASFTGALNPMVVNGRSLTINATSAVGYTASGSNYLSIDNGGSLAIAGTLDINADIPINSDQNSTLISVNGGGFLNKNGGVGFSRIAAAVNNNGTVNVTSGQLAFNGGGTSGATINVPAATNILAIEDKNYSLTIGSVLSGTDLGAIRVDGSNAVLTVSTPLSMRNVELLSGKIVGPNVTVTNKLLWSGGTIQGAGTFTINGGAVVDMSAPTSPATLDNITFANAGTFTYNGTTNALTLTNNATLSNSGIFDITGNGFVLSGAGSNTFQNTNILKKTAGNSGTRFDVVVNNAGGTISSEFAGGTIIIAGGGSMTSGTITTTVSGALVHFFAGTFTVSGGTFTGSGKIGITGGTLQINASTNATTTVQIDSGVLDCGSSTTFQITTLEWNGGTIQGAGSKRIFGGFISAVAPTTLAGTGTLTLPAPAFSYDADNVNYLTISSSATINIEFGGTTTITASGIIAGASPAQITGGGTLIKSGASTARINVPLNFNGSLNVTGGILELAGGGTLSGSTGIAISSGARVDATAGTLTANASATISGAGTLRINAATVALNTNSTIGSLLLESGALDGTGSLTVDGGMWSGGDMNGTGTTIVGSGKVFEIAGTAAKALRRNFTNLGTLYTQSVPASLTIENAAVLTNNNLVELQANTSISCTCSPSPALIHNAAGATLRQLGAAATSSVATVFDNDGTVDVQTGTLNLLGGGTHAGSFTVAANTLLSFAGVPGSFSSTSAISGTGAVEFGLGTNTFAGTFGLTGDGLTIVDGDANFTSLSTINTPALDFRGGVIGGTSNVAINGGAATNSSWTGGTLQGSGSFTLAPIALMAINPSPGAVVLDGRTLTNNGTVTYSPGTNSLQFMNGASLVNAGTFDIIADGTAVFVGGPTPSSFINDGTFVKSAGSGVTQFYVAFTNNNVVNLNNGTVAFDLGFTQTAGTTTLAGGTLTSQVAIDINGGSLGGNGTTTAIWNAGTLNPGLSPGGLTITGSYTQLPTGVLNIELGGTTPVTQYDQLTVTGAATLDGTINFTLFGGFVPADGNTFDALTFASSTGTFSTENLPPFAGGGSFTSAFLPTSYRLTAVTTQADVSVTQSTSGPTLHGQNATFTLTVTNSGSDPATGVTLTDTMTGGSLVSATSTTGSCTPGSPIVCTIGALGVGQSATVTITVNANTIGTISNSASVTANEFDPNTGNNATGTTVIGVAAAADLSVTVTDSADPVGGGTAMVYTVTVNNAGPDSAASAAVQLTATGGSMTAASGGAYSCSGTATNMTCTANTTLGVGTTTITVNVTAPAASGTMSLKAAATSATGDPNSANNIATQTTAVGEITDLSITKTGPASVSSGGTVLYTIVVANNGTADATGVVINDPTPSYFDFVSASGLCSGGFPCALGTLLAGQSQTITATYMASSNISNEGRVIMNTASVTSNAADTVPSNNQDSVQTSIACNNVTPVSLAPSGGQTVPASGSLTWQGDGKDYVVYLGPVGTGCSTQFGTTTAESLPYAGLTPGATYEWRVVSDRGFCTKKASTCVTFQVEKTCTTPETPLARVVGQQTSGKVYAVAWDSVLNGTRFEVDEATNAQFTDATTFAVQGLSKEFKHDVTVTSAYYYRVRAFNDCGSEHSPDSPAIRVVIVPIVTEQKPGPNVNIPAGTQELVVQQVFIPGEANQSLFFNATTDRPWLTVRPANGPLPPQGVTLDVIADPRTLPNGTFTASLLVTITNSAATAPSTNGVTTVTVPVSINLVTPVTPVTSKNATSQYAMIIPSIGHLDGINSFWQSDVRITNAGFRSYRYRLTFTPSGGTSQGVKETTITVDAGATTALDDIVRNWYGLGALGDNAGGMLEIVPLDDPAIASLATVASSRTYDVTDNGTLGQFIPALRINQFITQAAPGGIAPLLSLQQIAESSAYRTNVGVLEAFGAPANVLLSVFNSAGAKVLSVPLQLAAGEQRQLNSFLAQNNVSLPDGRIEVQVAGGTGKVSAYASVIDNNTRDPLLVNGTLLTQSDASKWVLPGVASIDNPVAHWRTDMRVFNFGAAAQPATLTFYPGGNGTPKSVDVTLDPGAVLTLDDVLQSKFDLANTGGVVQVTTPGAASLVVTGRTYNQTSTGTFGQFIPAVTPLEAVGAGDSTLLHILQVEDSTRYRTNIGLAEVTGAPAVVELQVILPDSKITPTVQIPLAANEFRQIPLLRNLALGNVYNARVTARVVSGNGRVTAYGSVIDEQTQDPTYVPAQK